MMVAVLHEEFICEAVLKNLQKMQRDKVENHDCFSGGFLSSNHFFSQINYSFAWLGYTIQIFTSSAKRTKPLYTKVTLVDSWFERIRLQNLAFLSFHRK